MSNVSVNVEKTRKKMIPNLSVDRKYELYEASVQCPEFDIDFFTKEFHRNYRRNPKVLREDFCGTGYLSCEWVKHSSSNKAYGIDLDPVPIDFGKKNHYAALTEGQKKRMNYLCKNVMGRHNFDIDIVAALNFSYCIFKKRKELVNYFRHVRKAFDKQGMFFLDIFGGIECMQPIMDEVEHDDFYYYWDCDKYNPVSNECLYKIHFKEKGKRQKYRDVFVYDWRLWTVPELVEALEEAGFSRVKVFWEGDDEDGGGDGEFFEVTEAENCDAWVSYIVGIV